MSQDAIYIGDTAYDMKCASGAGVDFALALWGCNSPDHIKAAYYFKTPEEIGKTLQYNKI
jgi:phosphoglycolate phosphatase-like HAD superfamily hydrolase